MDRSFHAAFHDRCNYLSMLKLNHVSKGPQQFNRSHHEMLTLSDEVYAETYHHKQKTHGGKDDTTHVPETPPSPPPETAVSWVCVRWVGAGWILWVTCTVKKRTVTEVRAWISNNIQGFLWGVITHPCPIFNSGLPKPLLKLGHGWVITSHCLCRCN